MESVTFTVIFSVQDGEPLPTKEQMSSWICASMSLDETYEADGDFRLEVREERRLS